MAAMAMPPVHEQVHQWAQGQKHPRQELDHVRAVLGPEKIRRDRREPGERNAAAQPEPDRRPALRDVPLMVVHRPRSSPGSLGITDSPLEG